MKPIETVNPATGKTIRKFEVMTSAEVREALEDSVEAFGHWRKVELARRLDCVVSFEKAMQLKRIELAQMMTEEMGKVSSEALSEVDKCITSCKTLREQFPLWKVAREYELKTGFSVYLQPLGPVLGIMPWNFPLWQVVRFAVPALLCGNTVLLKHAPNTWGSAELIEDLFRQAFPDSVFINLRADLKDVESLIADPKLRGVSLTGSRAAGQSVGRQAGEHLKKCVLELGGSDAYVLLDDANVEEAAKICTKGRLINAGQSCVAAKRFVVTAKNAKSFSEALTREMREASKIGPLARGDLRQALDTQVKTSVAKGAKILLGGQIPEGPGFFYPPTVLMDVKPGQPAFDEELFGPVAAIIVAESEDEAIKLANQSPYGLGGAIFSQDIARAKRLALNEMDSGMVFVNDFVKSDASVPFGGVKDSGLGRELGREGVFEFTVVKTVYAKP